VNDGLVIALVVGAVGVAFLVSRNAALATAPTTPVIPGGRTTRGAQAGIDGAQALATGNYQKVAAIAYDELLSTPQKRATTWGALSSTVKAPQSTTKSAASKVTSFIGGLL
jgi:hypothetical protein